MSTQTPDTESLPAAQAQNGHAHPLDSNSNKNNTLILANNTCLTIEGNLLLVEEGKTNKIKVKKRRTCAPASFKGSPASQSYSIPLYNILWAELSPDTQNLIIDHAESVSKTQVRAAKLVLPLKPYKDDDDHSAPSLDTTAQWIETLLALAYGPAPRKRRAYVLVNPHAGPGGAQKKWDEQVHPIFAAARMVMTIHRTTYAGEAVGLAQAMDIDAFDIIVPCSGDGLPHECFKGLGRRPDAARALRKIAVAHIPCGSGNALACNVFGTHRASLAALAIVKGVSTPMDLISITQETQGGAPERTLSFLSQTLGVLAEADLGTEHLRWMGEHRFVYGTVKRILKKKTYPCDLYVKMEREHKEGVMDHYRRRRASSEAGGGLQKLMDGTLDEEDASAAQGDDNALPPLKYGTVGDEVPEDWVKVPADEIGTFYAGNLAYMAPDTNFFNAAMINDGCMDIFTVDGNIPAAKVPSLLLSIGDNTFFDNPLIRYFKASAFRILPKYGDGKSDCLSIDGERFEFAPFQAEVHRALGRVITKRGVLEAPGPNGWEESTVHRYMA